MNTDPLDIPVIRRGLEDSRVLIVEEDHMIAWAEAEILAAAGCQVVGPVMGFDEAAELIGVTRIDAAIVDGTIKGDPTTEIIVALRTRNIPFAIITAYGRVVGRNRLPSQFRDVLILDKPFKPWHLVAAAEALLNRRIPFSP